MEQTKAIILLFAYLLFIFLTASSCGDEKTALPANQTVVIEFPQKQNLSCFSISHRHNDEPVRTTTISTSSPTFSVTGIAGSSTTTTTL